MALFIKHKYASQDSVTQASSALNSVAEALGRRHISAEYEGVRAVHNSNNEVRIEMLETRALSTDSALHKSNEARIETAETRTLSTNRALHKSSYSKARMKIVEKKEREVPKHRKNTQGVLLQTKPHTKSKFSPHKQYLQVSPPTHATTIHLRRWWRKPPSRFNNYFLKKPVKSLPKLTKQSPNLSKSSNATKRSSHFNNNPKRKPVESLSKQSRNSSNTAKQFPKKKPIIGSLPKLIKQSPNVSNSSNTTEPLLRNWKKGTFCHDFFVRTFQTSIPMCNDVSKPSLRHQVECFGSPYSKSMATCVLENIVVSPSLLQKALWDADHNRFTQNEHPIALLNEPHTECANLSTMSLRKKIESGDYVTKVMDKIASENRSDTSVCETWINETTFFFTAHRFHIFFRFLDYFNVHKLLEDMNHTLTENIRIIRVSGSDNYHFPEFDQSLFPEANTQALDNLRNVKTCFKKVILVPKSYASFLFQCKMKVALRKKCYQCDGRGLNETQIIRFRKRVIKACSLNDDSMDDENNSLVLVSRRPYLRNQNDKIMRFERIMSNEKELVKKLRKTFGNSTVHVVHLENLTLCEQISYSVKADVYLAVHGAGLVHLWWMRDTSLIYELEPHYEVGNPTFRMLSHLSGQNYRREYIGGGWKMVNAPINSIIRNLKQYSTLQAMS